MSETLLIATVAFWILAALVVFLPIRWSVIAFLLLVQFDLSGADSYHLTSLGIVNAIRVVAVPSLLLFRIWPSDPIAPRFARLRQLWLFLTAYAALASAWSPYWLSATKMLGYLYAYSVLFVVLTTAWRRQWFNTKSLTFVVWIYLLFAIVQTYVLGNEYGNPEFEFRFTGFTGAQSFAPFLLSLIALLLFRERWNFSTLTAGLGAFAGLVLTGSRSMFFGFAWVLLTGGLFFGIRAAKRLKFRLIVKRIVLGGAAIACSGLFVLDVLPDNRLNEILAPIISSDASVQDVGTFAWRYSLYQKTLEELASRGLTELFVGSGTSSGTSLALDTGIFLLKDVDPNRVLHDEFLRSLYEWGVPGLLLLVLFLAEAVKICLKTIAQYNSREAWAFLAICVPLLISLTVENVLADGGSPGGIGYNLVLTSMVAAGGVPSEIKKSHGFNTFSGRLGLEGN